MPTAEHRGSSWTHSWLWVSPMPTGELQAGLYSPVPTAGSGRVPNIHSWSEPPRLWFLLGLYLKHHL